MKMNLKVWRQKDAQSEGRFETYPLEHLNPNMSFLEMLDSLNEHLTHQNIPPVEFDSDCREGICGSCSCVINGQAHGPERGAATCQLYLRKFVDGDTIVIEPWRSKSLPVVRDLVVDRSALDRIIAAGGYTSVKVGPHADANAILIPKADADRAMDYATCIGCGACIAACPNSSASLFTSAKIAQMSLLPQGKVERERRVQKMIAQMDAEGFGHCTNIGFDEDPHDHLTVFKLPPLSVVFKPITT
jgi:succinate dehydrogenase / fumarate reductase iron-sulfur subunit